MPPSHVTTDDSADLRDIRKQARRNEEVVEEAIALQNLRIVVVRDNPISVAACVRAETDLKAHAI
jgi:D-alanine-D-alanine ligase-like ATP-grasp enzyme